MYEIIFLLIGLILGLLFGIVVGQKREKDARDLGFMEGREFEMKKLRQK